MATWTNDDGLKVRFGLDKVKKSLVGSPAQAGEYKVVTARIEYDRLPTVAAGTTQIDVGSDVAIPSGAQIVSATFDVSTPFDSAGDSATLSFGLEQKDGTEIDDDGIDATIAETAIDADGDQVACDGALVGGAHLSADGFLNVTVGTEAFTAGKGKLTIKYYVPA